MRNGELAECMLCHRELSTRFTIKAHEKPSNNPSLRECGDFSKIGGSV
jgi:hypothetical protein